MNTIKKVSSIGIPVIIGLGFAWIGNRIIRNENKLENRELELKLQLESRRRKLETKKILINNE
tara:strand:- start:343 stop:531 length:189 start_codon:yes stop_codon:yes gene_type:complete